MSAVTSQAQGPTRDDRSTFTRITETVLWFVVADLLVVLSCAPTVVVWMLLAQDASNLVLYAVSALCVPPALTAALAAWRRRDEDPEPDVLRAYLRGYRRTVADALKVGVPAVLALTVLGTNLGAGAAAGFGALNAVFVLLALAVVLLALRALVISSAFTFRLRDLVRLSVFTLLTMPLRTLALVSLGVLTLGSVLVVGDYVLVLAASVLSFALWRSEQAVLARVRAEFVAS
ncbi:hypothetical protein [Brachybacterium squillarum]|uniref:hypothetical protein n=1 Tax=Brachybacterium squillarum TaxID=661979 RepID=UPI002223EC48|nr:hypothetical protein [Brachybacterium squillarum]MCW1804523.1 hypothetical protein [Brachybacterium squillarum]